MITLEVKDSVAHIVLDNPSKLNALDEQAIAELDKRIGRSSASKVMEAVRILQFAALRGEGQDRHDGGDGDKQSFHQ